MLKAMPISLKEANEYVDKLHRHHKPVVRDKYRVGVANEGGELVGVCQVGNPVARMLCDGKTLEVVRCCTDGTKDYDMDMWKLTAWRYIEPFGEG